MRYFCDLCGTEVPRNTVRCPTCGRYFTAIQCPRCGFRGEEKDFAQGCPKCGYMKIERPSAQPRKRLGGEKRESKRTKVRNASPAGRKTMPEPPPQSVASVFVYRLIGIVLVVILIVLVVILLLR